MKFDRARRQAKQELSEKPPVMLTIKTWLLACPQGISISADQLWIFSTPETYNNGDKG